MNAASLFPVIVYFLGINLLAMGAFYGDKQAAKKNQRRISEKTLLLLAFMGGSIGALIATKRFRHKRLKGSFMTRLYGAVLVNILILGAGLYLAHRL